MLESQLSNISASSSLTSSEAESQASKTRFELCELLSDIILSDPMFAMRKDISSRLWRGCFYGRIGELRERIGKERNRLKRALTKEKAQEHEKVVAELEKNLKVFLDEAVVLYDYLINKYQGMLLPPDSQSQSLSQQSSSSGNSSDFSTQKRKKRGTADRKTNLKSVLPIGTSVAEHSVPSGVIPTLHRLLIHLGDLHRYAFAFHDAEVAYLKTSKLAPGKGNPYNQLAVVAQLKDSSQPMTAVALYWYARSLLAVHDPFVTSRANVGRLFGMNKQWLDKQDGIDDDLSIKSVSTDGTGSRKSQLEQAKAAKSVASRLFLSKFVDLHWDFFRGVRTSDNSSSKRNSDEVLVRMSSIIDTFASLLSVSAFGDALLCKMVGINAFSVEIAGSSEEQKKSNFCMISRMLAKAFTLAHGAALANKIEIFVSRFGKDQAKKASKLADERGQQKLRQGFPSVRFLSPLLLLCEYVATWNNDSLEQIPEGKDKEVVVSTFKRHLADFSRNVSRVVVSFETVKVFSDALKEIPKHSSPPKEYLEFKGFAPFQTFISSLDCSMDATGEVASDGKKNDAFVYISPPEAVVALELASPDSESVMSAAQESDTKKRLHRFVALSKQAWLVVNNAEVQASACINKDENEGESGMDIDPIGDETCAADVPEAGNGDEDIIVYKPSDRGAGPALLVPSPQLLKSVTNKNTSNSTSANVLSDLAEPDFKAQAMKRGSCVKSQTAPPQANPDPLLVDPKALSSQKPPSPSPSFCAMDTSGESRESNGTATAFSSPLNNATQQAPVVGPPPGFHSLSSSGKASDSEDGDCGTFPGLKPGLNPSKVVSDGFYPPAQSLTEGWGSNLKNDGRYGNHGPTGSKSFPFNAQLQSGTAPPPGFSVLGSSHLAVPTHPTAKTPNSNLPFSGGVLNISQGGLPDSRNGRGLWDSGNIPGFSFVTANPFVDENRMHQPYGGSPTIDYLGNVVTSGNIQGLGGLASFSASSSVRETGLPSKSGGFTKNSNSMWGQAEIGSAPDHAKQYLGNEASSWNGEKSVGVLFEANKINDAPPSSSVGNFLTMQSAISDHAGLMKDAVSLEYNIPMGSEVGSGFHNNLQSSPDPPRTKNPFV